MSFEERQAFRDYVNLVEKCMNPDADPRDDFLEYAVGGFKEENFDKTNGEFPPTIYGCGDVFLRVLENEQISNGDVEKVRDFYKSRSACLEGGLKEYLRSDQFNEFCGGVPAFNDNWSAENFNSARAAGILLALQYKTILRLYIEHYGNKKLITIEMHQIEPPQISCIPPNTEDILKTLELEEHKSVQIINDLNLFKELYPEHFDLEDEFQIDRTGIELQNFVDFFDFKVFIETALSLTIHDEDRIYFQQTVMSFLTFLNTLDRRVLANYITAMALYENFKKGGEKIFDVEKIFQPILVSACFETLYNEIEEKKYEYMAERFKKSFESMKCIFTKVRNDDESLRRDYKQIIYHIKKNYNSTKIREEYKNLEISPDNFQQNLIKIKNHGIPRSLKRYYCRERYEDRLDVNNFLNFLIVHRNKPIVFHFSGQEINYWRSIIEQQIWENDLDDNLVEILETQAEQFEDIDLNCPTEWIIYYIEAITYAYRDYKRWLRENETTERWQDEILSTINLNCEKLFFISFSQHNAFYPHFRKCIASMPLMNCKYFTKTFECSPESRMNPRKF